MLQSSFNLIKEHFSSNSPHKKNIFLMKDYDYPTHFIQKLYLSYLQLQQTLMTSSTQEIIKKINLVTNKNDSHFQNTILGIIYGFVLNTGNIRPQDKKVIAYEKQGKNQRTYQVMDQKQDAIKFSQLILRQLKQVLPLFRVQAWNLFNNVTFTLIMNHFHQIKPIYKFGLITLLDCMQQFESCSDNLFILIMKTLNFYDQSAISIKYNLELIQSFSNILKSSHYKFEVVQKQRTDKKNKSQLERNNLKTKNDQQISLMRLYLFVKLVHIQYLAYKMRAAMKGEWPLNLQRVCMQGSKLLKKLFASNPQQCLVFSAQLSKYTSYVITDPQLQEIFQKIREFPVIKTQMLSHHFNLVPLSVEMMLPFQLQQSMNQIQFIMNESGQGHDTRIEKSNFLMSLGWIWKQFSKKYSGEQNKSYLLENVLPDIVRWAVSANGKNMQFKMILIEWALYQCPQNESLNKLIKQAFFQDIFYYLKNAQKIEIQLIFPSISIPLYILNYFSFYSPHVAQQLFMIIFSRLTNQIADRQASLISEDNLRYFMNQVLYKASAQGILRTNQIIYHSHLGSSIKNQIEFRMKQSEQNKKNIPMSHQKIEKVPQKKTYQKLQTDDRLLQSKPQMEYYGAKNINIQFNLRTLEGRNNQLQEQDLIYTSHELIPSSPSYQPKQPSLPNLNCLQDIHEAQNIKKSQSFKRECQISTHQLEKQLSIQQLKPQQFLASNSKKTKTLTSEKKIQKKESTHYEILLQKQFYEEMGTEVNAILENPTVIQFGQFMKHLTKTLKDYKKSGQQQEIIETFIQESCKILYLAFNNQFQAFNLPDQQPQNPRQGRFLTYFLLKSILQNWKHSLSIYHVTIYKKIVKTLIESFPQCQFTFYLTFLDIFKKGFPHFKEMKSWLIEKQRQRFVIPVLQKILGQKFKIHLYQNAQVLKIQ